MPKWLQIISDIFPLTQGIKLMKGTSLGLPLHDIYISLIVLSAITVVCVAISIRFFKWDKKQQ